MEIIKPSRRGFITGLISFVAAPAVIRTIDLMPVVAIPEPLVIVNGGSGYIELAAAMRRAFIPKMYAQMYSEIPAIRALAES